ncbi:MAG: hypothetical protein N5P05_002096 [Chroococcopsis gigantea SAG 12.99]|nr:hypothetical protein [Chroococcopsis gigantea SAG 12.99]
MMTAKNPIYNPISIREFTASKQTGFETLKRPRFSGQLVLTASEERNGHFSLFRAYHVRDRRHTHRETLETLSSSLFSPTSRRDIGNAIGY